MSVRDKIAFTVSDWKEETFPIKLVRVGSHACPSSLFWVLGFLLIAFAWSGLILAAEPAGGGHTLGTDRPAYRIGPEDVLEISVWREEELHREVLVRPDGGISFPLAGDLQVAGRTPQEVQEEITRRIKKYIPDAVVTVSAKKISGYTIFVIGRVNKPGQFVVGRYVDVVQALTLAGGLSPYGSEEKIKVLRRADGTEQTLHFNYAEIKKGINLRQNILLQSGDVVVVP